LYRKAKTPKKGNFELAGFTAGEHTINKERKRVSKNTNISLQNKKIVRESVEKQGFIFSVASEMFGKIRKGDITYIIGRCWKHPATFILCMRSKVRRAGSPGPWPPESLVPWKPEGPDPGKPGGSLAP